MLKNENLNNWYIKYKIYVHIIPASVAEWQPPDSGCRGFSQARGGTSTVLRLAQPSLAQ